VKSMVKSYAMPFLGMAFFWVYFRYQSFFGLLYPLELDGRAFGLSLVYPVFLTFLLALCVVAVLAGGLLERVLRKRRLFVPFAGILGSVGVMSSFAAIEGLLPLWVVWMAMPLVTLSFATGCWAWALFFCSRFTFEGVTVMIASYGASLLVLSQGVPYLIAALAPAAVGVTWKFAPFPRVACCEDRGLSSFKEGTSCIVLLIVFLFAGSVLRGIVDTAESNSGGLMLRWPFSLVLSGGMLAYVVRCEKKRREDVADVVGARLALSVERIVLKMWMALSLLFFAALFGGFLEGSYIFSGNIVVAVRSMLDVLLWVTLCGFSYAKKASPILMFSVFGIPTDVASWALSYVAVPDALDAWADGGFAQALDALALLAAFASLVSVVVVLGWSLTRGSLSAGFIEGAEESVFPKSHADQSDVRSLRLTEREAEVASLFARGHSVKKVASLLFISTSTVQSHMKSVYRKLGVHSRDELKEKLSGR